VQCWNCRHHIRRLPLAQDGSALNHNAHLLLDICQDEAGSKLLHIAGLSSSNG
jgi:hypothetical protein